MAERPDKQNRKAAIDRWKVQQQASARAALPLPDEQMQALFDMLDAELPREDCDHTLRLTLGWLNAQNLMVEPVVKWLHDNGGFCDCEVLANAEEAWREATGQM